MNFVVLGAGPAGIHAVEAIRKLNPLDPITLISGEPELALSPVMLTYWVGGKVSKKNLLFRDPSWPERMRIDLRLNSRAGSLNTASKKTMLADGQEISYDRVLIATGSVPIVLPIPGIQSRGVNVLHDLRDGEAILEKASGVKEVVIIGGGFIGLKLACHLNERGFGVTIVEKEPKLASRMFDLRTSRLVEKKLREGRIRVEVGVEVTEVLQEKGWVSGTRLKDGRIIPCQRIIQAVGVKPNIAFLKGSGIEIEGGVLVNERMETNVPAVFAAGDVAMTIDPITSKRVNNATWPAASRQGLVAGTNMGGGTRVYHHNFALNSLHLFGLQVMTAGHSYYEEEPGVDISLEKRGENYRKIVVRSGHLIGFILTGNVSGAGFLLNRMKRRGEILSDPRDLLSSSLSPQEDLSPNLGYSHGIHFQQPS